MNQGDVYSIEIKESKGSKGSEVQGKGVPPMRPCVIVSPDVLNKYRNTLMVAPLTSTITNAPFRAKVHVVNRDGEVMCDQIFTVDKSRFVSKNKMAALSLREKINVLEIIRKIFS
jgi:mRNA interferase MazF